MKEVLEDIKKGKPVIIVDDYTREDEADLVLAAQNATISNLLFCMKHARGLMCIPCTEERLNHLQIPMMPTNKKDKFGTPFTVSVDAIEGCSTGMSVYDRLKTIQVLVNKNSRPEELSQPGHLFPLRAHSKLLQGRRGHTESSVELVKLAGLDPISIIIEIMNDDGTMLKGHQVKSFAELYGLNTISIEEIYYAVYQTGI